MAIKKIYLLSLGLFQLIISCQLSVRTLENSAGINGGFEISHKGLPVNWLLYAPKTVPNADFNITLDTIEYKEGKQSLRFDVKTCSDLGEWRSPGFTNEFFECKGKASYKLIVWTKNNGVKYRLSAGGVNSSGGEIKTLVETTSKTNKWEKHEFVIDIPETMWLRIQLNILSAGTCWIDDIHIEKIHL